ncbi:hypothetical protein CYLTODRAFT_442716 [Cylindrobasidium torrendii FP15055 ss-10]|uniref:Uncharacterized protein n=1 Tax=Cylindrobasidium torrendii FP15055 ss-10 TaxID=1314674 RepID=A0A0D7BGQ8_9AGAR|nr:hypothetical protein CYLTODRAFT_442716 [Cylindrobasidium torrendii FP15055 ss-10]
MAWSLPQELTDQIVSVAYHTSANPSETLKALCLTHSTFRAQARRLVFGHVSLEWPTLYPRSYRQSTHAFRDLLKRSAGEIGLLVRTLQVTGAPDPSRDPAVLHVLAALPLLTDIVFASCGTAIMRMVAAQLPRLLPPLVERVAFLDNYYVENSEDMYALVGKFPRLKGLELRDAFWHRYISKQAEASIALKTLILSSDGIGSDGELDREDILQFLLHPSSPITLTELETLQG